MNRYAEDCADVGSVSTDTVTWPFRLWDQVTTGLCYYWLVYELGYLNSPMNYMYMYYIHSCVVT